MGHETEHVESLGIDPGDVMRRTVRVGRAADDAGGVAIAEGHAALGLDPFDHRFVGLVIALAMRDRHLDDLTGAVSPGIARVGAFAADGGLVLGICNGFQILTEAGLLPGALRPNESLSFVCRDVPLVVESSDTPFTARCTPAQSLSIPVKHGDGCWFADEELLDELEHTGQIVLRYAAGANPNGSVGNVAGVMNLERTVFGLMPHPEHAVDPLLGSTDGALILGSLVDAARLSAAAFV